MTRDEQKCYCCFSTQSEAGALFGAFTQSSFSIHHSSSLIQLPNDAIRGIRQRCAGLLQPAGIQLFLSCPITSTMLGPEDVQLHEADALFQWKGSAPEMRIERMARVLSFSDVYHLFRIRGKPTAARSLLFREARDLPRFPLLAWRKQSANEIDLEPTRSPKLWGYGYRSFLVSHLNVYLPSLFTTSSDLFKQRELNLYSKQPIQRSQGLYGEGTMCIYRNKTSATMATSEQTV